LAGINGGYNIAHGCTVVMHRVSRKFGRVIGTGAVLIVRMGAASVPGIEKTGRLCGAY
jgi:hypothetical protein